MREAKGLLEIINYTNSLVLLNRFDGNRLKRENVNEKLINEIEYTESRNAIDELRNLLIKKRKEATRLFEQLKGVDTH